MKLRHIIMLGVVLVLVPGSVLAATVGSAPLITSGHVPPSHVSVDTRQTGSSGPFVTTGIEPSLVVPLPASIWLFVPALLGVLGLAHKPQRRT